MRQPRPDIKKLFWPRRFPRIKRFPRLRPPKPGFCYCGKRAKDDSYVQDPLSKKSQFRGFCSDLCHDVLFALVGLSYAWQKKKFARIREGLEEPQFYEIRRFPRLEESHVSKKR